MSGSTPADVADLTTDPDVALALMGDSNRVVRDDFAGPGGWSTGIRDLLEDAGLTEVALEWDAAACLTRVANGHVNTIRADVAAYPVAPFLGRTVGYIGSPPCQTFSMAGDGTGRAHIGALCEEVRAILLGRRTYEEAIARLEVEGALDDKDGNPDPRNGLILVPARVIRALLDHDGKGPTDLEWVALEQVPPAGIVFDAYAMALRELGFSVAAPVINAADYGVPQTRERKFVLASRVRTVTVPEPTHTEHPEPEGLFGPGRLPWVAFARALGWLAQDPAAADLELVGNVAFANTARRPHTAPAPTITGGKDYGDRQLVPLGPAGRRLLSSTGRPIDARSDGIRLAEAEGGILQGFPEAYVWTGPTKALRWQQIGNVVCPPVARRVVAELLGVPSPPPLPWQTYAHEEPALPFP